MTVAADGFDHFWSRLPSLYGNRPMMVWDVDGSSFLAQDAVLLASAFARLVLDRAGHAATIALCAPTRPETLIAAWGTWLAGGTVMVIDPHQDRAFLDHALTLGRPALCLAERPIAAVSTLLIDHFADALAPHAQQAGPTCLAGDNDPGALLFTSGSSGAPKGVLLSRGGLWRSAAALAGTHGWTADDIVLCTAPLHSMSGLRNPALAAPWSGATLILDNSPPVTRALSVGRACRRHRVSVLTTAPALLDLLAHRQGDDLRTLRMILTTGATLHQQTARSASAALGVPVYDYYGMTETTGACIMVAPGPAPAAPGMIGRPVGCRVEIQGPDGLACPDGTEGELLIGGDNLMLGYVGDPDATSRAIRNGWLHTGDIAIRHPDGMIELKGRRDSRVKTRDGEIVYPATAEAALLRHPLVRDAHIRARAGSPALTGYVVFDHPGDDQEKESALRHHMKNHVKYGDILEEIIFVKKIPRTESGKFKTST